MGKVGFKEIWKHSMDALEGIPSWIQVKDEEWVKKESRKHGQLPESGRVRRSEGKETGT